MQGWDENGSKPKNTLPIYGNKESMNLNSMILTNVVSSPYFKEQLFQYKTFHEVVDEIYYKVDHLEPWEKNSRKLAGQVGMCAGVRGVAAGGIVSTAFCLLFKMFTLKLTRKQLTAMLEHRDSPYIRGIGFLYIRYCQPPADFWNWFSPYMEDDEEIDLKAGGGYCVTIGEMCRMMLSKLDWFGTLFPRLPVNVQRELEEKLRVFKMNMRLNQQPKGEDLEFGNGQSQDRDEWGEAARRAKEDVTNSDPGVSPKRRSLERRGSSKDRLRERRRSRSSDRIRHENRKRRSWSRDRKSRSRSRDRRKNNSHSRDRKRSRSRSRDRKRSRSRSRDRKRSRSHSRDRKYRKKSRSRSRDIKRFHSHSRDRRSSPRDNRRSHSRDRGEKSSHSSTKHGHDQKRSRSGDHSQDRTVYKQSRSPSQ